MRLFSGTVSPRSPKTLRYASSPHMKPSQRRFRLTCGVYPVANGYAHLRQVSGTSAEADTKTGGKFFEAELHRISSRRCPPGLHPPPLSFFPGRNLHELPHPAHRRKARPCARTTPLETWQRPAANVNTAPQSPRQPAGRAPSQRVRRMPALSTLGRTSIALRLAAVATREHVAPKRPNLGAWK